MRKTSNDNPLAGQELPLTVDGYDNLDIRTETHHTSGDSSSPSSEQRVVIEHQEQRGFAQKCKTLAKVAVAGAVVFAGWELWQFMHQESVVHEYHAEIELEETQVFKDVTLQLAGVQSTFHLYQHTTLDRSDDALIDWNPFDYNTTIDEEITTLSYTGLKVARLEATVDPANRSMDVTIDSELSTTLPAVDWNENSIDITIGSNDIGVGTGEINKAQLSADQLIQAAAGIATACALREGDVQALLAEGVSDFIKTTSFTDQVDADKITITITDLDDKADQEYERAFGKYNVALATINKRYSAANNAFSVEDDQLTNCDKHTITIVPNDPPKTAK